MRGAHGGGLKKKCLGEIVDQDESVIGVLENLNCGGRINYIRVGDKRVVLRGSKTAGYSPPKRE